MNWSHIASWGRSRAEPSQVSDWLTVQIIFRLFFVFHLRVFALDVRSCRESWDSFLQCVLMRCSCLLFSLWAHLVCLFFLFFLFLFSALQLWAHVVDWLFHTCTCHWLFLPLLGLNSLNFWWGGELFRSRFSLWVVLGFVSSESR